PAVTPPAAGRPPALRMEWHDLCFLHWAVPARALQRMLPRGVQLDTRAGQAYLGVVPFRMEGVAPLHVPDVPGLSAFPELNLRTYVTVNGEPGVWFYSLDVTQPLAAALARTFFHLPYRHSRMWVDRQGGVTRYASELLAPGTPGGGRFAGAYRPTGEPLTVPAGSLEAWLTDRLNLFSADRAGRVYRGRIEHRAWPLRRALAQVRVNTLADPLGLTLTGEPHALHAERLDVRAHWLERVR
ncbi:YqjF family protein, partial [Deinococcus sp. RIT780]|uniref:YqjF family protein n=1 Tax=Deinococcus sp. RIT780 TaxID=2870472 RepID=UPI00351D8C3F